MSEETNKAIQLSAKIKDLALEYKETYQQWDKQRKPELRAQLTELVTQYHALTGDYYSDDDVQVYITADSESVRWDTKVLEALMLENPEKYGWLAEYREVKPKAGSLTVK